MQARLRHAQGPRLPHRGPCLGALLVHGVDRFLRDAAANQPRKIGCMRASAEGGRSASEPAGHAVSTL